jgi:hypothetical protein
VIRGSATLDDDRYPYSDESVYDGWTSTYEDDYTCSTDQGDYTDGEDLNNQVVNTAEVWSGGAKQDESTATTEIDCYLPSIEKTADGAYDERHEWMVEKTVDPLSQAAFIGDTVYFDWTITVSEEVFEENFDVSGTITVGNPNPEDALVVSLEDWINGNQATIDQASCAFDGTYLTVAAGGSEVCDYEANGLPYDDVDLAPDTNTATITLNGIDFDATDPIEWTANVIRGSATLDDDRYPYSDESVYDGWTSTYEDEYTCSTDQGEYTDGMDLNNEVSNTAEVYSDGALQDSSTATTEIDCYLPAIEKSADATFDRTWTWTIEKWGDQTAIELPAGETSQVNYEVTVDATYEDDNFDVSGTITVGNPNPEDALVVSLEDWINGNQATIDQASCAFDGTYLTVAAGGSEVCDYELLDQDYGDLADAPTLNTATITLNGIDFDGEAPLDWEMNEIDECIEVKDDNGTPGDPSDDVVLGTVCADDPLPHIFYYFLIVGPYSDPDDCGERLFINTASFITNDTLSTGFDTWTVVVEVICEEGCTLTQGYWKTHSEYGPAPYDDTWAKLDDGADTPFFDTGYSWYEIFQTAPKGGNAYIILAHQYMAAYLSSIKDVDPASLTSVMEEMAEAEELLDYYDTTYNDLGVPYIPEGDDRVLAISIAEILDQFNNGDLPGGPPHCEY